MTERVWWTVSIFLNYYRFRCFSNCRLRLNTRPIHNCLKLVLKSTKQQQFFLIQLPAKYPSPQHDVTQSLIFLHWKNKNIKLVPKEVRILSSVLILQWAKAPDFSDSCLSVTYERVSWKVSAKHCKIWLRKRSHVVSNHSNNVVINLLVTELTLWVAPPKILSQLV